MILNWNVSQEDHDLIVKIAERALRSLVIAKRFDLKYNKRDLIMDLTAVHANGTPLRLSELLAADDFNFTHDVCGIHDHLDRQTGQLMDCFVPRFTAEVARHLGMRFEEETR